MLARFFLHAKRVVFMLEHFEDGLLKRIKLEQGGQLPLPVKAANHGRTDSPTSSRGCSSREYLQIWGLDPLPNTARRKSKSNVQGKRSYRFARLPHAAEGRLWNRSSGIHRPEERHHPARDNILSKRHDSPHKKRRATNRWVLYRDISPARRNHPVL